MRAHVHHKSRSAAPQRLLRRTLMACAWLATALPSWAAGQASGNVLPDCYAYAKIQHAQQQPSTTALFVVIDQTTPFSAELQQSVAEQIGPWLQPGNSVTLFAFSAYTQGYFTRRLVHAELSPPLEAALRDETGKALLGKFDQCLAFQAKSVRTVITDALRSAFGQGGPDIAKSDVLASLRDISKQVHAAHAQRKLVLLASDMLENSSISSFYHRQAVRRIEPAQELARVTQQNLVPDFGGADVYILGAGLVADDQRAKGVYRDPQTMRMLESFWRQYFEQGHARLVEFGAPALLGRIQ